MTDFVGIESLMKDIENSNLILLGARPAMGKTAFALSVAKYAALGWGKPVVYFSLEMSEEQLRTRIKAMDWISDSGLIIDDTPAVMVDELREKCKRLKEEDSIGLIIIDYLQLINEKGCDTRQAEMSSITQKLKKLACELSVPIIMVSQHPKCTETRENHRPVLQELRFHGAIEQDIDMVVFLYRDEYYNRHSESKGIMEVIVAKQYGRNPRTIELTYRRDGYENKYIIPF